MALPTKPLCPATKIDSILSIIDLNKFVATAKNQRDSLRCGHC
jgi:hypothetical protein